jgi:pimeloyl-ACP methyl ester carboxylesterase
MATAFNAINMSLRPMFKKIIIGFVVLVILLVLVYTNGPRIGKVIPDVSPYDLPVSLEELDELVARDSADHDLKTDNGARIIWADSVGKKTAYSLVYLHGFSASQEEGDPVHETLARRYEANLYLNRMPGHGIAGPDALATLTVKDMMQSVRKAIAIGKKLGDSCIIMATSTGATLALPVLAANDDRIAALLMYSPLVTDYADQLWLLRGAWGKAIGQLVLGEVNYRERTGADSLYWSNYYHLNGYLALSQLLEAVAQKEEIYRQVKVPVFMGYYYKDAIFQDHIVSVSALLEMFGQLGSEVKVKQAFPEAGHHVIGSYVKSEDVEGVTQATIQFLEKYLPLTPVTNLQPEGRSTLLMQ